MFGDAALNTNHRQKTNNSIVRNNDTNWEGNKLIRNFNVISLVLLKIVARNE